MNCPNCNQLIEAGAAFCGNCGQELAVKAPDGKQTGSHIAQVLKGQIDSQTGQPQYAGQVIADNVPNYAITSPLQHVGETKAILSILLGVVGIIGALLVALVGLVLGIAGLMLGTMSRNSVRRGLSTAGIIVSSIAIVVSLGVWAYVIHRQTNTKIATATQASDAVPAANLSTPCYSTGFIDTLNVTNSKDSCDMKAFNGPTLDASTKAYKVYSSQIAAVNSSDFNEFAKKAVQKDIAASLPGFTIDSQQFRQFAGSPAYVAYTSDKATGVTVAEAVVLHQVQAGANVFVLVHASGIGVADLSTLEAQWQWK